MICAKDIIRKAEDISNKLDSDDDVVEKCIELIEKVSDSQSNINRDRKERRKQYETSGKIPEQSVQIGTERTGNTHDSKLGVSYLRVPRNVKDATGVDSKGKPIFPYDEEEKDRERKAENLFYHEAVGHGSEFVNSNKREIDSMYSRMPEKLDRKQGNDTITGFNEGISPDESRAVGQQPDPTASDYWIAMTPEQRRDIWATIPKDKKIEISNYWKNKIKNTTKQYPLLGAKTNLATIETAQIHGRQPKQASNTYISSDNMVSSQDIISKAMQISEVLDKGAKADDAKYGPLNKPEPGAKEHTYKQFSIAPKKSDVKTKIFPKGTKTEDLIEKSEEHLKIAQEILKRLELSRAPHTIKEAWDEIKPISEEERQRKKEWAAQDAQRKKKSEQMTLEGKPLFARKPESEALYDKEQKRGYDKHQSMRAQEGKDALFPRYKRNDDGEPIDPEPLYNTDVGDR